MRPTIDMQKIDGGTGVVRPSDTNVCAFLAPSSTGTNNRAEPALDTGVVAGEFGDGALVEGTAYIMPTAGKPMLLVKANATTAGAYGTVSHTNPSTTPGTSVVTGDGTSKPRDDYNAQLNVLSGGTIGTGPISIEYSLDGGQNTSAPVALGVATSYTIPDSGVKFDFASGTLVTGDIISVPCTGPISTNADLINALEGLRQSDQPYEIILFHGIADATTVSNLDTWITAQELVGKFKLGICTCRPRATDGTETEAQYLSALTPIFANVASINVVVAADVGDVASPIPNRATTGMTLPRPAGWAIAARLMKIEIGEDAAFVGRGPVPQFGISDTRNNPKYHNEAKFPGLDNIRLSSLTTIPGKQGTFITNALIISTTGSDYVYAQHARTMNQAAEIGFAFLAEELSKGVRKSPHVGPNGERYINEGDALRIEQDGTRAIKAALNGQVNDVALVLSRTDDISDNDGADVHGSIQSESLAYIKKFTVTAGFVKSITK